MWAKKELRRIQALEGGNVCVALRDGSRIDDCQLVSAGRRGTGTLWLYGGQDIFVPLDQVIDLWESRPAASWAA
jgi:hypothetical protein